MIFYHLQRQKLIQSYQDIVLLKENQEFTNLVDDQKMILVPARLQNLIKVPVLIIDNQNDLNFQNINEQSQNITNTLNRIKYIQQFNIQSQQKMYSRYTEFNSLELCSMREMNYPEANYNCLEKGPAGETTDGIEENIQQFSFYMKSSKNITNSYQISFQSDFIKEHESVFKRQLRNYMEFVRIQVPKNDSKILNQFPKGLYGLNTGNTSEELINEVQKLSNLLNSFKIFDKLKQFLDIVCNYCPQKIAIELMNVANEVLQAYQEKADNFMSCSELMEISEKVAQNLKIISVLKLENLELKEKYSQFMKIYCATVILVIGQFFENPFIQHQEENNLLKRPLDSGFSEDDQENYESTPAKKRKYSF